MSAVAEKKKQPGRGASTDGSAPKVLVLRSAGTNCDGEAVWALEAAGAVAERVHINEFLEGRRDLGEFQGLVVPGGFSFGDDIASGKVFANKLLYRLHDPLLKFQQDGKPILGICNGFQILVKCGLLPGSDNWDGKMTATLSHNDSGKFECRWVYLKAVSRTCAFTKDMPSVFALPVAHGEGKFVPASKQIFKDLEKNNQIVFRYVDPKGQPAGYPWNPNGSFDAVAGICNKAGNIMGLMPHPERNTFAQQHCHWARVRPAGHTSVGFQIFKNMVRIARPFVKGTHV
jgi:phosphoribosylformylglycinamidine synthase I